MIEDGVAKPGEVYLDWARRHFERCRPWIEEALERQLVPSHTIDNVWEAIESGNCVIWPTDNSVSIVEIVVHPTGIRTLNGWLSGGDLEELKWTEKAVTRYAKDNGFYALTILGRDGWGRVLEGYRKGVMLFVKDIAA
jgi:hypothetical protein